MVKVCETICGGFAESRVLELHGERMVANDFAMRAAMSVQLKDMDNALDAAAGMDFDVPITRLFAALYASGIEHGRGDSPGLEYGQDARDR